MQQYHQAYSSGNLPEPPYQQLHPFLILENVHYPPQWISNTPIQFKHTSISQFLKPFYTPVSPQQQTPFIYPQPPYHYSIEFHS